VYALALCTQLDIALDQDSAYTVYDVGMYEIGTDTITLRRFRKPRATEEQFFNASNFLYTRKIGCELSLCSLLLPPSCGTCR
jgi:hypothetical protein